MKKTRVIKIIPMSMILRIKRVFFRRRFNNFSNGNNAFWALCDYFRKSRDMFSPGNWDAHVCVLNSPDPVSAIKNNVKQLEQTMNASYEGEQLRLRKISTALFCIVLSCFVMGWVTKYPEGGVEHGKD